MRKCAKIQENIGKVFQDVVAKMSTTLLWFNCYLDPTQLSRANFSFAFKSLLSSIKPILASKADSRSEIGASVFSGSVSVDIWS